ncbi:40S ribosomal protein S7 [Ganoderma leucocontextum]|nr:40S ribosomal protein S7 [Ganoderma leucocontextum]
MATENLPLPQPASIEEKLAAFDTIPLFMRSLPEDGTEDPAIAALQSLAYEGTPDEVAQSFKEQGNDYYKGKRYREALGFYSQGVDAKPTDKSLLEALLCNRAACNLELQNYGSVLRDCSDAITMNPHSSKAYYRSTMALIALDRYDQALDACDRCLQFDKENKTVKAAREKAAKLKEVKDRKEHERQERIRQEQLKQERLQAAYRERNIIDVPVPDNVAKNSYEPHFDPEDPSGNTMILPVLFMYPQYTTTDLISHFQEDTPFSAHLNVMFPRNAPPPEWDKKGEYVDGNLVVLGWTRRRRLLKIGKKMTLRDACKAAKAKDREPKDGLEMRDGTLTFVVLPKGAEEQRWMSVQHKIFRTANAPRTPPDETEIAVAQAIIDLENSAPELKGELRPLQISAAREVDVRGGKKAIVIFVPVPQLKAFHKVQQRLTRELEKKFSDRHVVFVAQRRMLRKPTRTSRVQQKRPRSRTLTNVHDKILEDLVYPTEIVGKRTRVAVDGSKLLKVFLDAKDATSLEYKLDSFSSVYRRLTGKDVVFEFPVQAQD